ncbi:hypothetical protein QRD02_04280 [Aequorivita sp. SDUM287046]|uniref:Lacal_2735 family protein n=1 Tax=Aequorivita aurantiaca TaxID=3053356 RepID=A0ABT8DEL1_9FLAO|nr:hypothetical protein [Aequorivita aurantiaca]MDN3723588.1 hypothetical protein [Aequorivita aurantiaca]
MFKNFKPKLEHLTPEVRKKALEIAQQLMKRGGISEDKAIDQAIVQAEQWFFDMKG